MFGAFFCANSRYVVSTAWGGAALVLAHACIHGLVKFLLNDWYKNFYNLLEDAGSLAANGTATDLDWAAKRADVYAELLVFGRIAAISVFVMPLAKFVRSMWALEWRMALMRGYTAVWDANREPIEGASQRVHEDSYRFSRGVELCLTAGLDALITLIVFIPILYELGSNTACPASLAAFAWLGGAWLVGLAVASAIVGFLVTLVLGRRLVQLEVENQVAEARLRKDLVVLETSPGTICGSMAATVDPSAEVDVDQLRAQAVYMPPLPHFVPIFACVQANYRRLFCNFTLLNLWLALFDQANIILPYLVFGPLLFATNPSERITLGTLVQISNGFDKIFGALSIVAENWPGINEFRSVVLRLGQFEANIFHGTPHPSRNGTATRARSGTRVMRALPFASLTESTTAEIALEELRGAPHTVA